MVGSDRTLRVAAAPIRELEPVHAQQLQIGQDNIGPRDLWRCVIHANIRCHKLANRLLAVMNQVNGVAGVTTRLVDEEDIMAMDHR